VAAECGNCAVINGGVAYWGAETPGDKTNPILYHHRTNDIYIGAVLDQEIARQSSPVQNAQTGGTNIHNRQGLCEQHLPLAKLAAFCKTIC
jgi:hypothetical protein